MVKNANLIQYSVNPDPLEMKGDADLNKEVPVVINVTFPPKYFHKKAYLVITPALISKDGNSELPLKAQTLQGEKVSDNNPAIKFKEGGSYTYRDTLPYDAVYRVSTLNLKISANKGGNGKSYSFATVKIANGIVTTPELVDYGLAVDNGSQGNTTSGLMRTVTPTVELPKASTGTKSLVLYYPLQKADLATAEQKKAEIDAFVNDIKALKTNSDVNLGNLSVASYASPDGPEDLNKNLVDGRGTSSTKFVTTKMTKAQVQGAEKNDFLKRTTTPTEDWEGFKKAVQESNMKDKEIILRVLSMYSDPVVREKEIKNLAAVYDELRNKILPQLRRTEIIATYETKPKTPAELINLGKTNPTSLSQVELFYGAQVATGTDQEVIYKNYTTQYTDDWKGFNNLAVYYLKDNKIDLAEAQFQKAEKIDANNATIKNNMGVLYWAKGDYKKAETYFNNAVKIAPNDDANYNLGVICIKKGQYANAVQKFGTTPSYNKSLAQILNGNAPEAANTLKNVKSESAYYFYLKAVQAARTSNEGDVMTNLRSAVQKNASLKAYAANDLEFRAYFENESFKSIVQ
jgi:tetratricopeptide (TPR) repeat protein